MSAARVGAELFDGTEYEVPYRDVDGRKVNKVIYSFGGSLERNRDDTAQMEQALTHKLGTLHRAVVMYSVDGVADVVRGLEDSEGEVIETHRLRIHSVEPVDG